MKNLRKIFTSAVLNDSTGIMLHIPTYPSIFGDFEKEQI
jgi:hypothetical protein